MPRPVGKAEDGAQLLYALAFETRADARGGGEARAAGFRGVDRWPRAGSVSRRNNLRSWGSQLMNACCHDAQLSQGYWSRARASFARRKWSACQPMRARLDECWSNEKDHIRRVDCLRNSRLRLNGAPSRRRQTHKRASCSPSSMEVDRGAR
ncbi:uncharacterized protein SCHCODRAFT_02184267 [Schizophyllum commune H4-8]|uniref:uncharacterized protein n=1 Tax=Schizophyllum commune (strain H4-8 / FGSC 9210) TaxID=578458 RepID=UPI00215DEDE1|nr:uncharacterized protein SCHCODRAFT_02184267 [Schizophyllum commune H4-8]KAI5896129.1 hypothetical protein SCHCODRAFT_02184267 [Schizophyllum commune H4-8]